MKDFWRFVPLMLAVLIVAVPGNGLAKDKNAKDKSSGTKETKPFEDVIKDLDKIEGLFTFYVDKDEGKVYMAIKPEQFGRMYLCNLTRSAGDGAFYDNGAMLNDFPFEFRRVGKKVQMMEINLKFRADTTTALHRAIGSGVSNSLFGVAKIESDPEKGAAAILVDPSGFFIKDVTNTGYFLGKQRKLEYTFDSENSYFGPIKSFPENSEIDVIYHFKTNKPNEAQSLADVYSMMHTYHFSLSTLPETGYVPRIADDRVGFFQTIYQDYTELKRETPYVRYISRWRLEKAYPESAMSAPKEPIVFWLENTIPEEYREYVKEGVLIWNRAFEKAGFRDAIVVKQMPDTASWDPADVRYNTIRWVVYPGGTYAVGPSRTNPFTGQIYDADVRICVDFIRWMFIYSEYYVDPLVAEDNSGGFIDDGLPKGRYFCDYANQAANDAAFAMSVLDARNDFDSASEVTQEFVRSYIVELVCHEVGHTLGLRHNFKASISHTNQQRHDKNLTQVQGVTASVMDYNPANIAPEGVPQGEFWHSTPGTYDYWAIEYGYKPIAATAPEEELPELERIAANCGDPLLPYGTDEDVFGNSMIGIDPYCSQRDLSDDPIAFYRDELALSKELWSKIEERFEKPGNRYQKLLAAFDRGWRPYFYASILMPKFVAGINRNNYHVGDTQKLPFEPVSAAKQKEAMEFLSKNLFAPDAFEFPAALLNKLQLERLEDFGWSAGKVTRVDYPIHDRIFSYQKEAVDRLYDPIALARLQDIQLRYEPGKDKYDMAGMFADLRRAIWTPEVTRGSNINSFRRRLQRYHLDKVIDMAVGNVPEIPEDARTLARNDLKVLMDAISRVQASPGLDTITRAHLEESKARIDAALKAGIERSFAKAPKQPETD